MPSVVTEDGCTICDINESVMHSHHTVPQSRGGKNSLQIILCSSCHNILHANAVYIVSCIRNPKRKRVDRSFWSSPKEEQRAQPWLELLVAAFVNDVPNPETLEHPVGTLLSSEDWQCFKRLSKDLGTSQDKTLEYCIKFTLAKKGIKHEQNASTMWFLPVSKQREDF